jgi:hypothetical protein
MNFAGMTDENLQSWLDDLTEERDVLDERKFPWAALSYDQQIAALEQELQGRKSPESSTLQATATA